MSMDTGTKGKLAPKERNVVAAISHNTFRSAGVFALIWCAFYKYSAPPELYQD